jgi:RHS repeat-associated protein
MIKFMKPNLSWGALSIFGLIIVLLNLFQQNATALAPSDVNVTCGGYWWSDSNPSNICYLSCGSDPVYAEAWGGMSYCPYEADHWTCAAVTASVSGKGLEAVPVYTACGDEVWRITIIDSTKPGTVTLSATVSGDEVPSCDYKTLTAIGQFKYIPDGCTHCLAGGTTSGSGTVVNSSVEFRLNLGKSTMDHDAGYLWLYADAPSTNLAQPISLQLPISTPDVAMITNMDGSIAQVLSAQGLFNVHAVNAYQYQIQCFYATNVTAMSGGLYGTNAPAFDTWVVQNPDTNSAYNRLWITEQPAVGVSRQFQYTFNSANQEWDLLEPDGQTTISTWKIPNPSDSTITNYYRQAGMNGNIANFNCKTYQYIATLDKKLLLQEVNGTGISAQTNTFTYYTAGSFSNLLQQANYATGNWKYYTYDSYGRVTNIFSAYNNSSAPTGGTAPNPLVNHCKLTSYAYDVPTIDTNNNTTEDIFQSRWTTNLIPVQGSSGWALQVVACQFYYLDSEESDLYQYINPGVDSSYLYTGTSDGQNWFGVRSPWEISHPDGTSTFYDYPDQFTTIEYDPDGSQTTNVTDELGNPLSITRVESSSGVILSRQTYTYTNSSGVYYDQLRRNHDVTDLAGRTTQYRYYDCCSDYTVTDPDGNETQYTDDLLKRPVARTVFYGGSTGITQTNILDGAGRTLVNQRIGTDGTAITLQQSQYDLLGNLFRQTNALGGVTTITNVIAGNQLYVTNTYPDGGNRIEAYYSDGRLQSVTGSAVHPVEYVYGAEQDGTGGPWREYTLEIKLTSTGGTNEWTKTYVDGVGHSYKTIYSAASGPYPASQSYYNEYGQLWKQVDPDGVTTLYDYCPYNYPYSDPNTGQIRYTVTALSSTALGFTDYDTFDGSVNSLLTGGGIDRIQKKTVSVIAATGSQPDLVQYNTYVWTNGEVDGNGTLIASQETATTTLTNWNVSYASVSASITNTTISSPGSSRTEVNIAPDNSYTISLYSYGRLASSTRYDSTGAIVGGTTYTYDSQGRQYQVTDVRNGTTTYGYNNADLVTSVTTPNPGTLGASPQTTLTYYNPMLQATNVVQPDGTSVVSTYLLTGELGLQSGSRTYPVAYSYDYAGRMNIMTNWSGFSTLAGARVTIWNYDQYRGWLTSKAYDDGHGPSYTYTAAGRLASRIWARGVTTSYVYDNAGSLTNITYSDATPAVTNSYDRLGRLSSAVVKGMTDTMTYNLANQLLIESFSGGLLNGLSVTNAYDQFLRRTNLTSLASGVLRGTAYGYDYASRLSTVSDGTNNANYSYLANSPLVSQITFKSNSVTRMTTTKQYDYLNRLTAISSVASNSMNFNYSYNNANQRVRNVLVDGSYWVYTYDALGQVTGGNKFWSDGTPVAGQQFGYAFDTIGNRTQTQTGGDASGANLRTANYYANNLNQITNRDIPAYVDIKGVSFATNTVTVNGQTAYRKGEYFRDELGVNNTSAALWTNLISAATSQTSVTGNVYVAQQPESFKYDADGNLTNDGRFSYAWDGENRLTNLTSLVSAPTGSKVKLDFAYDSKSRRIQKIVSTNNGTAYFTISTNRFLYDGWNLVAEAKPNNSLIRSYTWGTDLSGSAQGAGGVSGLLEVSCYGFSTTNCFLAYDGNGNVVALVNAADGTTLANYEYGPFGEVIRSTGVMAKNNPFRFSTKYDDDESDLLYYGYRYYKPSTGAWPNRDPLQERGGKNLYEFVNNNPLDRIDFLGMDTWVSIVNRVKELDKAAEHTKCCCDGKTSIQASLSGVAVGSEVFLNVATKTDPCVKQIISYVWWDCFTAYDEGGGFWDGWLKNRDNPNEWHNYGYRLGGSTTSLSHSGLPFHGWGDENHWAWSAYVIYQTCAGGRMHVIMKQASPDDLQWTWNGWGFCWSNPPD